MRGDIPGHGNAKDSRHNLLEELKTLACQLWLIEEDTGDVAPWSR
jgi:hypothetical protein